MRYIFILALCLQSFFAYVQVPEFSELSGSKTSVSQLVQIGNYYYLWNDFFNPFNQTKIYKINTESEVLDSINLREWGRIAIGTIKAVDGKLYFGGLYNDTISNHSQRYNVIEFDSELQIIREYESDILDTLISPLLSPQTVDGITNILFDFTVYEDTVYAIGRYLQWDTTISPLGAGLRYLKGNLNGETYQQRAFDGYMYNAFFRKNELYFQGSNSDPNNPFLPPAVGFYDGNGQFIDGWNFDNSTSGEFPWGACGGAIDDKLYFSYLGRDPSLDGCSENNVAIDVRDTAFNVLHRFKIDECGYLYAGNMPFTKGVDGSIYFQAAHEGYKMVLIQKYTPNMQLIWSEVFDFSDNAFFTIPMGLVSTEDGGVIAHCRNELNGQRFIRLYKISPDGDIISSTTFGKNGTAEAAVLSPNPCMDEVRYTGTSTAALEAWLYSMDGRIQKRTVFEGGRLDMSTLPAGLYSVLIFEKDRPDVLLHRQTVVKVE